MKLGKLLKHIDYAADLVIWYADNPRKEFDKLEVRTKLDVPKWLKKYELIKLGNNNDSEAICPCSMSEKNGIISVLLRITVVKEQ